MFFHVMLEIFELLPVLLIICTAVNFLLRLLTKDAEPRRDYTYQPKVSVLVPVYNEGENILNTLNSIINADWPRDKLEIIAYDDFSKDDSMMYVQQIADANPGLVRVGRNPVNSGKHLTVLNASKHATGEIFIVIDSDCIFHKDVIKELVACFGGDSRVGAVGGSVGITNVNDNVYTMAQSITYFRSFQLGKLTQILQGGVSCISGCLFSIRASVYRDIEDDIKNLNFLGVKVRAGEDRYMTHTVMLRGWRTLINPHAICWTSVPNKFDVLFKQQLRWSRSALRDAVWTLVTLRKNFRIVGVNRTLTWLMPYLLAILVTFFALSCVKVYGPGVFWKGACYGVVYGALSSIISAMAYNFYAPRLMPGSKKINSVLLVGLFQAWGLISLMLHFMALFSFDQDAWGTREKVAAADQSRDATPAS